MKKILTLLLLISIFAPRAEARGFEVPENYSFKGQYEAYEKQIVKAAKWLQRTAPDKDVEKRRAAKTFISKWIMGAPHVTVALNSVTMGLKNISGDLHMAYLGGSIRHGIKTDNKDLAGSTYAGMKAAIKYYKKHKNKLGENETFEKYARLLKKGELRQYLKDNQ